MKRTFGWIVALVVVVAVSVWAGRATLSPSGPIEKAALDSPILADVVSTSVGTSIPVGVTLSQPYELLSSNHLQGVVTAIGKTTSVKEGGLLYTVAGVPVHVVQGVGPFYRALSRGTVGQDVKQLQDALRRLGYSRGAATGEFGTSTQRAVMAWQRTSGSTVDGTVELGELVAAPVLPTSVRLGQSIKPGAVLGGGEEAVLARTGVQLFTVVLAQEQAGRIPSDATFEVRHRELTWEAVGSSRRAGEGGETVIALEAPGGGPVCGKLCSQLPPDEVVSLAGEAVTVPEVTGPAVPASAVRTDEVGRTYVNLPGGDRALVQVVATGRGLAIVDGVRPGDVVVVAPRGSGQAPDGVAR